MKGVMSHITAVRKKADLQKGVREATDSQKRGPRSSRLAKKRFAKSLQTSGLELFWVLAIILCPIPFEIVLVSKRNYQFWLTKLFGREGQGVSVFLGYCQVR